ncbi:MAG: trypsin-like serine protease [Candidatus Competibacteraceae bacterium]|nr:trypsin-like serine protease [Candidatus Competibacteraceae bacterium]
MVKFSENHDLALLKLDNYQTPALLAAATHEVGQGVSVYAIGSPIGIRDSVSNGVVSGFADGFIRTDAKIYPGNSGGPLVLENGRVVGINTMVQVTHKFEGLGYAIKIDTALQEFAGYLPTK